MLQKRVNLLGIKIDDISMKRATFLALKSIRGGDRRCFFTPNLQMLSDAHENDEIKELLNSSSVSLPDGAGLKLVARIIGIDLENTVVGIDFGERLLSLAEREGAKVFLLGGERGVAGRAAKRIMEKHPRIRICGAFHGYFKPQQAGAVCRMIERSDADILIVCQGFPRQELFARFVMERSEGIKVIACLGGSLDVWSGDLLRAPVWMREIRLEWLFRLLQEPSRCARFLHSLDILGIALERRIEKMLLRGIKEQKRAYNQTDIL